MWSVSRSALPALRGLLSALCRRMPLHERRLGLTVPRVSFSVKGRCVMNWDRIKGNWKQLKGQVQQKWGKLTDNELDQIDGRREELLGMLQERYGLAKEQVERELDEMLQIDKLQKQM